MNTSFAKKHIKYANIQVMIQEPNDMIVISQKKLLQLIERIEKDAMAKAKAQLLLENQYLTRRETAKILTVSPQTISKYVANGLLKNHSKTSRYRFLLDEVNEAKMKRSR